MLSVQESIRPSADLRNHYNVRIIRKQLLLQLMEEKILLLLHMKNTKK